MRKFSFEKRLTGKENQTESYIIQTINF